jgi:hypothetical protein
METPIAFSQPSRDADKTEPGASALSVVLCRAGHPTHAHATQNPDCSLRCTGWGLLAFTTPFLYHTNTPSISLRPRPSGYNPSFSTFFAPSFSHYGHVHPTYNLYFSTCSSDELRISSSNIQSSCPHLTDPS